MKHQFFLLATFVFPLIALTQTVNIGPSISVADDNAYGKTRARIVLATNDVPVVMWGRKTTDKVYVSRFVGGVFTAPVNVTPPDMEAFVSDWAGPDVASDGDDVFVTFHSQPENTGYVYVVKSTDGGMTFGDTVRAEDIGADQSRFPTISVDPNGNPAVIFMRFEGNYIDPQYVVGTSTDGGQSFQVDVSASELAPGEVCDCCPAGLINEGQRKIAMFRNNDGNLRDIWVTVSEDNGADFDIGNDVDPNNWIINACPSTGPDGYVDQDSLYTVWMSAGQGSSRIFMSSVYLPTATRGTTWEVAPDQSTSANQNYPRIAGSGQTMGIVYQQASSGNTDCYLTVSTNGGASFSQPIMLHESAQGTQRNPDITYANGVFNVVYEDVAAGGLVYHSVTLTSTGISEAEADFNIWADGEGSIHINTSDTEPYSVNILNLLGKEVFAKQQVHENFVFQPHRVGVYLIRVTSNKFSFVRKVTLR